uniref:Uncharacterized protein n=1 Tax=Spironucleus salmonicida TaxID=348837 RepID=V6LTN6_9EUKA|eukprot:EST48012.1 Hypothetical protein SS50377_11875 [Spironucleus salmonicida]
MRGVDLGARPSLVHVAGDLDEAEAVLVLDLDLHLVADGLDVALDDLDAAELVDRGLIGLALDREHLGVELLDEAAALLQALLVVGLHALDDVHDGAHFVVHGVARRPAEVVAAGVEDAVLLHKLEVVDGLELAEEDHREAELQQLLVDAAVLVLLHDVLEAVQAGAVLHQPQELLADLHLELVGEAGLVRQPELCGHLLVLLLVEGGGHLGDLAGPRVLGARRAEATTSGAGVAGAEAHRVGRGLRGEAAVEEALHVVVQGARVRGRELQALRRAAALHGRRVEEVLVGREVQLRRQHLVDGGEQLGRGVELGVEPQQAVLRGLGLQGAAGSVYRLGGQVGRDLHAVRRGLHALQAERLEQGARGGGQRRGRHAGRLLLPRHDDLDLVGLEDVVEEHSRYDNVLGHFGVGARSGKAARYVRQRPKAASGAVGFTSSIYQTILLQRYAVVQQIR